MAHLGYLLVCTFGKYLTPVLVAEHTVNNLDLGDELENEDYESDCKGFSVFVVQTQKNCLPCINLYVVTSGYILVLAPAQGG